MVDGIVQVQDNSREAWENLTITNDFVFCKAMQNTELCREVIEAILGIPIERVVRVDRQEVLDAGPDDKGVRLDIYARDSNGRAFDVEMQAAAAPELLKRARYYHAMMAIDQLDKGGTYRDLTDSYVIFICAFDPLKRNRRVYSFRNVCLQERDLDADDGVRTVFLAATSPREGGEGDRLDELLDYVARGEVGGGLSARLDAEVARVLGNQTWRREYMLLEMKYRMEREAGREEGIEIGEGRALKLIAALIADKRYDDLRKATDDASYCDALYREYGITWDDPALR